MQHSHGGHSKHGRNLRAQGRASIGRSLKVFKPGVRVRICADPSHLKGKLSKLRFNNRIGVVLAKQGNAYRILVKDGGKDKEFILSNLQLTTVV